jgi:hypothetical protein
MDSASAALIGAGVGLLGGIGSQFVSSALAAGRESKAQERREQRTRSAISAMLIRLHELLMTERDHGVVWDAHWLDTALAPIQRVISEPDLLLDLEPDQSHALIGLVGTLETAIRVMPDWVARAEEQRAAAGSGQEKAEVDERLRKILQSLFTPSETLCVTARVALGESQPLRIDYAEPPSPTKQGKVVFSNALRQDRPDDRARRSAP